MRVASKTTAREEREVVEQHRNGVAAQRDPRPPPRI